MSDPSRTKYQAILDLRFAIRFNMISARYYNRLRLMITGGSMLAGMSAVTPVLQSIPFGLMSAGLVVALGSIANGLWGFTEKAIRHEIQRQSFLQLLSKSAAMSVDEIDAESDAIACRWGNTVERLTVIAHNDNLLAAGWDDELMQETFGHRVMRLLA